MSNWKLTLSRFGKQTIFSRSFLKSNYSIQDSIALACLSCQGRVYSIGECKANNETQQSAKWLCYDCGRLHDSRPKSVIPVKVVEKPLSKGTTPKIKISTPTKAASEPVAHSVSEISGISSNMAQRLYGVGVKSTLDLIAVDPAELKQRLGAGVSEARIKDWIKKAKEL